MIIKIHGTSGSGKTTAVRELMDLANSVTALHNGAYKVEAYCLDYGFDTIPTYVLGSYGNTCGGVDTISSTAELITLIDRYCMSGHLVFEGLLISTYHGALGAYLDNLADVTKVWAFMNTPIDECVERVSQRRLAAGNTRPFNEANTRNRVKPIQALRSKLIARGSTVVNIDGSGGGGRQLFDILYRGQV